MKNTVKIHLVSSKEDLRSIIALIQDYQKFYLNQNCSGEEIENFFSRFLDHLQGLQLVAREGARPVGFTTLYFLPSSLTCANYAMMNDLYVIPESRGAGIGQLLIEAVAQETAKRGFSSFDWMTQGKNAVAQRLYDRLHVQKEAWFYYSMESQK